eukprot:6490808-Amphidinium_carterae.1
MRRACTSEESFCVASLSPQEAWQRATEGSYTMGALYVPLVQTCRVSVHEPTSVFHDEALRASAPAWRTVIGFDASGNPTTVKQFWLALGRKQRQARLGCSGVMTFWTLTEQQADAVATALWQTWCGSDVFQHAWRRGRAHPGFSTQVLSTASQDNPFLVLYEEKDVIQLRAREEGVEQTITINDCKVTTNCPEVMAQCLLVKDMVTGKLDHLRAVKEMVLRHLQRRGACKQDATTPGLAPAETEQERAVRVLRTMRFPHKESRRGFEQASAVQFGLVTSRGHDHVSPDTLRHPEAVAAAHVLARTRSDNLNVPYLSVSVTKGGADWHTDGRNIGLTTTMALGTFSGGLLQVGDRVLNSHDQWVAFSGHEYHRVTDFQGDRVSVSLYTPGGLERVVPHIWYSLLMHGFPVLEFCQTIDHLDGAQFAVDLPNDQPAEPLEVPEVAIQTPTPAQRTAIHRAHVNLGHPTKAEFLRALRISGMAQGLRLWIKHHYSCPACDSCRKPGVRRPAILSRSFAFNVVVGFDSVELHAPGLPGDWYLNVTCWGSRYQQLYRMGDSPTSEAACKGLMTWVRSYGLMEAAVIDGGVEFKDKFAEQADHLGIFTHCTDSYAPHQNGRTERAGAAVKDQLRLALETAEVGNLDELELLVMEVVNCRNAYIDRSGYSAHQRVFGRSVRQVLSTLQEDHLSTEQLALDTRADFQKSADIRTAALASLFKLEARTRVSRAARAKLRKTEEFNVGQWIFIHRRNKFNRYWREGPAVVVMTSGATIWANHRGGLHKINKEMARAATTDELRGIEELTELLPELVEETAERRGRRQYKDLTAEVPADMEDEARTSRRRRSVDSQSTHVPPGEGSESAAVVSETTAVASTGTPKPRRSSSVGPTRQVRQRLDPVVRSRVDAIEGSTSQPSQEAGNSVEIPREQERLGARQRSRTPPRVEEAEADKVQGYMQKKTDE